MAKTKAEKAPTLEYILQQLEELKPRYADDLDALGRIRELRTKKRAVNVPQVLVDTTGVEGIEYQGPEVEDMLWDLGTLFTKERPSLSLTTDLRGVPEDLTTRLEKFTDIALFEECGCREPGPSTYERLCDATLEGGGWTMLVKDKDLWDERYAVKPGDYDDDGDYDAATEDAKQKLAVKKRGVPVHWIALDAMGCVPIPFGRVLGEFVYVEKRSLSSTMRQYGLGFDGDGQIVPEETAVKDWADRCTGDEIEFIQHWTRTWVTYCLKYSGGYKGSGSSGAQAQVKQWRHRYGFLPVFYAAGRTRNYEHLRVVGDSAAEPVSTLVERQNQLRTILSYLGIRDALTPFLNTIPDTAAPLVGDDGTPKGPDLIKLGHQYYGKPGQSIQPYQYPNNADKILQEVASLDQKIKEAMPAAGNVDGPQDASGFALSVRFERDDRTNSAFANAIKYHLTDVALGLWKLCKTLGEPVYVFRSVDEDAGYVKIDPAEFDTPVRPTWSLNTESASAKIILQRYLQACVAAGFLGPDQAIELLGYNVDEVHKSIAKARVRGQPWFTQWEDGEILAEWGRGDLLKMQQQAEQMAAFTQQANAGVQMAPAGQGGLGAGGLPGDTDSLAMGMDNAPVTGMPSAPTVQTAAATQQLGQVPVG